MSASLESRAGDLIRAGDHAGAVSLLAAARRDGPLSPRAVTMLALALLSSDRPLDAVAEATAVLGLDGADAGSLANAAQVLRRAGELELAVQAYRRALGLEPGHARRRYALAQTLQRQGRSEAAARQLLAASRLAPGDTTIATALGFLLQSWPDEVLAGIEAMASRGPEIDRIAAAAVDRIAHQRRSQDAYLAEYGPEALSERPFLNIGAGYWRHPAWRVVDVSDQDGFSVVDIAHDLLDASPLPLADGSIRLVYAGHVIEHIDMEAATQLFAECRRVLGRDGLLRIAVPDADVAVRKYLAGEQALLDTLSSLSGHPLEPAERLLVWWFAAQAADTWKSGDLEAALRQDQAATLDRLIGACTREGQRSRPHEHMNWWNRVKLETALRRAGFTAVQVTGRNQSAAAGFRDPAYFDHTLPWLTLYVEATSSP